MLEFLPDNLKAALRHVNQKYVYELRLRAEQPISVNYAGEYRYLGTGGLLDRQEAAIRPTAEDIEECVFRAGKCSIYAVEEQIRQGFITAEHGERIGLAGEYVMENGQAVSLRNFSSLCIRMPHEILGCSDTIYQCCMSDKVRCLLLMSSPGLGKTTILRDIARRLSLQTRKNILICDERGEISAGDVGESCDVLKFCDKSTAFEAGIRALRPDIIVTDELSEKDCSAVRRAIVSGIRVIASAHIGNRESLREPFLPLFERYALLDTEQIGKLRAIYDADGRRIEYD